MIIGYNILKSTYCYTKNDFTMLNMCQSKITELGSIKKTKINEQHYLASYIAVHS